MSQKSIPHFGDEEFQEFARLIEQPSHTPVGQLKKTVLVEAMYRERRAKAVESRSRAIYERTNNASVADDQAERELWGSVQHIDASEVIVDRSSDTRLLLKTLVITRGDPSKARHHVLVPAHIDTVEPSTSLMRKLTRDGKNLDRLKGIGVWDMQAGVYNSIALAAEVVIPQDLCVHFVFPPDEERHSRGARGLEKRWSYREKIMTVLSQEIGPLSVKPSEDDMRPRVVLGRPGRQKFEIEITLDQGKQGHFADSANRHNAKDIADELSIELRKRFATRESKKKKHPLLGPPIWESGEGSAMRSRMDRWPDHATFDFSVHARPGVTYQEQLTELRADLESIRVQKGWDEVVAIDLRPYSGGVSYEPFCMPLKQNGEPEKHPLSSVIFRAVHQVTGYEAVPAAGLSVADENLYNDWILRRLGLQSFADVQGGVISVPPRGNKAHNEGEWVSARSIMETREIFRWLMESPYGLSRLAQKGKKNH